MSVIRPGKTGEVPAYTGVGENESERCVSDPPLA